MFPFGSSLPPFCICRRFLFAASEKRGNRGFGPVGPRQRREGGESPSVAVLLQIIRINIPLWQKPLRPSSSGFFSKNVRSTPDARSVDIARRHHIDFRRTLFNANRPPGAPLVSGRAFLHHTKQTRRMDAGAGSSTTNRVLAKVLAALANDEPEELQRHLRLLLSTEATGDVAGWTWWSATLWFLWLIWRVAIAVGLGYGVVKLLLPRLRQLHGEPATASGSSGGSSPNSAEASRIAANSAQRPKSPSAAAADAAALSSALLQKELDDTRARLQAAALRELSLKQAMLAQLDVTQRAQEKCDASLGVSLALDETKKALAITQRKVDDLVVYAATLEQQLWHFSDALAAATGTPSVLLIAGEGGRGGGGGGRAGVVSPSKALFGSPAAGGRGTGAVASAILADQAKAIDSLRSENEQLSTALTEERLRAAQLEVALEKLQIQALAVSPPSRRSA